MDSEEKRDRFFGRENKTEKRLKEGRQFIIKGKEEGEEEERRKNEWKGKRDRRLTQVERKG